VTVATSPRTLEKLGRALQPAAGVYGLFETILAIITLFEHIHSHDTLPFINPLLWLNWVTIFAVVSNFSPIIATVSALVGSCLYGICFWLCIGYGLKGFGVRQYDVIDVPAICQTLNISWQTDPRRKHFVRLNCVMFAAGSLGLLLALATGDVLAQDLRIAFDITKRKKLNNEELNNENASSKRKQIDFTLHPTAILQQFIAICIILPSTVGVIIAGVLNGHNYLILGQHGCYASFVSGRYGYVDLYLVEWKIKLAAWIGLTT